MRIVEGYLVRQIARTTGIVLLIMVVAFLLERTLRLMRDIDPSALPLDLAAGLLLWRTPEILGIALPPAFFAGVLLTFQRLVRDSEIDVLYGAGMGPAGMIRPLMIMGGGIAALLIVVFWFLLPQGRYEVSMLMDNAVREAASAPLKAGSFVQFGGKVLYVEPHREHGKDFASIFLYEPGEKGDRLVTTAIAERFEVARDRASLFFTARKGQRVTIPAPGRRSSVLSFSHLRQSIYTGSVEQRRPRGEQAVELTFPELAGAMRHGHPPVAKPEIEAQFHTKLARVLAALLLPLAAVPLALAFPVSRQWMGIGLGVVLVLAFDQALIFGEAIVGRGQVSPWTSIWGAFGLFAAIIAFLSAGVGYRFSRGLADTR